MSSGLRQGVLPSNAALWIAQRIAQRLGFPPAGDDIPVTVAFSRDGGIEKWRRNFDGAIFSTTQEQGRGRSDRLLCERFGPCEFAIALVLDGGHLRFVIRRWSIFGIPLPVWLAPVCEAYEFEEDGRFRFFVELRNPLIGLIVRYQGWLEVTEPAPGSL
jgi:hypothetical protein